MGQTQAQNKRQGVVQSDFKFQLSRTLVSVYLSYDQGRDKWRNLNRKRNKGEKFLNRIKKWPIKQVSKMFF